MIDLWDAVLQHEAQQITLTTNSGGGSYDGGGNWIPAPKVATPTRAVVQPTSGAALRDLPEGLRKTAEYLLWTQSAVALDDIVIYGGNEYRVIFVWPRSVEGGYIRAAMGRKRDGQAYP